MKKRIHSLLFATLLGLAPVSCFGSEVTAHRQPTEDENAKLKKKEESDAFRAVILGLGLVAIFCAFAGGDSKDKVQEDPVEECRCSCATDCTVCHSWPHACFSCADCSCSCVCQISQPL